MYYPSVLMVWVMMLSQIDNNCADKNAKSGSETWICDSIRSLSHPHLTHE
jgi:hypothetical protein